MMRWIIGVLVALSCHPLAPAPGEAQSLLPRPAAIDPVASASSPATEGPFSRWELTLDGQVGVPGGTLQVGETNAPGTSLRLHHDLGIDLSESVQGGAAFHFTPRDALRLTFVYFFLDGSATISHPIVYNGFTFPAGRIHTSADFYRLGVAYERALLTSAQVGQLIGSVGITYVNLDAVGQPSRWPCSCQSQWATWDTGGPPGGGDGK